MSKNKQRKKTQEVNRNPRDFSLLPAKDNGFKTNKVYVHVKNYLTVEYKNDEGKDKKKRFPSLTKARRKYFALGEQGINSTIINQANTVIYGR